MLLRYSLFLVFIAAEVLSLRDYGPQTFEDRGDQGSQNYDEGPRGPPIGILKHKQAVTNDGVFNYVFAADNGLKQGESISPDGTRTGAYQYVDPNGKLISVKYTAGKDGFRILEGDHIPPQPKPVEPIDEYQPPEYRKGYKIHEDQQEDDKGQNHQNSKKYPTVNENYGKQPKPKPQLQKYTQPQQQQQQNYKRPQQQQQQQQQHFQPNYQQQQQQQSHNERHKPLLYNVEQRHTVDYKRYEDNGQPVGGGDDGGNGGNPQFKGGYNFEFKG